MRVSSLEYLPLQDGELYYGADVFSPESSAWFEQLASTINWEQSEIKLFGKTRLIPRLNAWYGDEGVGYSYSGMTCALNPGFHCSVPSGNGCSN